MFYKLNRFVIVKGYYAYKTKKSNDGWGQTDLLYLDPELRFNLGTFDLSNRFRFEYDFDKEELVYRNRLKFKKTLYESLSPFIQEEAFYSFSSEMFVENRFSVGLAVKVLNNIGLSAEYMLNSKKVDSNWKEANVLVRGLSFTF